MMKRSYRMAALVRLMLCLVFAIAPGHGALAHGGEDHGEAAPAPVGTPGASASMLTTLATTEQFELLLKYPPPEIGGDARLRFFLADYETNRPLEGGSIALSFTPAGVKVIAPPAMSSPGIYDAVVSFPADTIYSVVATVRAERRTDFLELRNIYAGGHATRFLAEHGGGSIPDEGAGRWPWWGSSLVVAGCLLGLMVVWRSWRRGRSRQGSSADTLSPTDSDTHIQES